MTKILQTNERGLYMCMKETEFDFNSKIPPDKN